MARGIARRRDASSDAFRLSRVCNIEDFSRPEIVRWIHAIFEDEVRANGPSFPSGRERRKLWEVAMALATFERAGVLRSDAQVLGVGAGNEPTIFDLTRRVGRVFATDLYLGPGEWREFANEGMLLDPGRYWPGRWNPRRLVVQHMDAMELRYEDESFDGVFSSSSFEHFGNSADVARAVAEVYRVLKPGGVFSVATEYRLSGPSPGIAGTLLFSEAELLETFVGDTRWDVSGPPMLDVSPATLATEQPQAEIVEDYHRHFAEVGELVPHRLALRRYPEVVISYGEHRFTSVHLALRKRRSGGRRALRAAVTQIRDAGRVLRRAHSSTLGRRS